MTAVFLNHVEAVWPIVFCLALTHSGLLCVSPVCRSFKKAWKTSTFAMVGGMQRVAICSTGYQTCKLLVGKGVSECNEGLGNDLVRRQRCARLFLVLALYSTLTRITKSTSVSIMVSLYSMVTGWIYGWRAFVQLVSYYCGWGWEPR